jgi:hypothetical protein
MTRGVLWWLLTVTAAACSPPPAGADPSRAAGVFATSVRNVTNCADSACGANAFTASDADRTSVTRDTGHADGFEHGGHDTGPRHPQRLSSPPMVNGKTSLTPQGRPRHSVTSSVPLSASETRVRCRFGFGQRCPQGGLASEVPPNTAVASASALKIPSAFCTAVVPVPEAVLVSDFSA